MNCQQIDRFIWDYCDNNLSPTMRSRIEKHLQYCAHCRNKVELTLMENEAMKSPDNMPSLSDNFTADLIMTLKTAPIYSPLYSGNHSESVSKAGRWSRLKSNIFRTGSLAAAVILVILLVPAAFNPHLLSMKQDNSSALESTANQQIINQKTDASLSTVQDQPDTLQDSVQPQEESQATKESILESMVGGSNPPEQQKSVIIKPEASVNQGYSGEYVRAFSDMDREQPASIYPARGYEMWSLTPLNIPDNYKLQRISSSGNIMIFDYLDQFTGNSLILTITPGVTETNNNDNLNTTNARIEEGSDEAPEDISANIKEGSEAPKSVSVDTNPDDGAITNVYETSLKYRNGTYHINLTGELSSPELADIGKAIKLDEIQENDVQN